MIACPATPERVNSEPRPRTGRLPRGEVHLFDNWCKGCGLCIEFCPPGVLVLGTDNRPKAIYPEKCTACRWCELHCPDFAIFVSDTDGGVSDAVLHGDQQTVLQPAGADKLRPIEPTALELEPENI